MDLIQKLFGVSFDIKSGDEQAATATPVTNAPVAKANVITEEELNGILHPKYASNNFLELFRSVPEVFWPIDFIASRIAGANFVVKRSTDDSVVWRFSHPVNGILNNPNCLMGWYEFIYNHFVYKLATGNAFVRAAMGDHLAPDALKWKYCDTYWNLPSDKVVIERTHSSTIPLFGCTPDGLDELIAGYKLNYAGNNDLIPSWQIWHDRDGLPSYTGVHGFLKSMSHETSSTKSAAVSATSSLTCKTRPAQWHSQKMKKRNWLKSLQTHTDLVRGSIHSACHRSRWGLSGQTSRLPNYSRLTRRLPTR